MFSFMSALCW